MGRLLVGDSSSVTRPGTVFLPEGIADALLLLLLLLLPADACWRRRFMSSCPPSCPQLRLMSHVTCPVLYSMYCSICPTSTVDLSHPINYASKNRTAGTAFSIVGQCCAWALSTEALCQTRILPRAHLDSKVRSCEVKKRGCCCCLP